MPLARDKPYLYVDGKKEDVQGAAMITPEFNQEELLQGKTSATHSGIGTEKHSVGAMR